MNRMMLVVARIQTPVVVMVALLSLLTGCGKERYPLSGNVTFDGKPVPFGQLILIPDESEGNSGPRSVVVFRDGHYETGASQSIVGGKYVVKIDGFEHENSSAESERSDSLRLFPVWATKVDLPQEGGAFDFDVPRRP